MPSPTSPIRLEETIFLLGMPRSGTTWLSQIFEASPEIVVRLSPNYSYPLKNTLSLAGDREAWIRQLSAALESDDPFRWSGRGLCEKGNFRVHNIYYALGPLVFHVVGNLPIRIYRCMDPHRLRLPVGEGAPEPFGRPETEVPEPDWRPGELGGPNPEDNEGMPHALHLPEEPQPVPVEDRRTDDRLHQVVC